MANQKVAFPLRQAPLVDARGYVSQSWLMFFLSLQQIAGEETDLSGVSDIVLSLDTEYAAPPPDIASEVMSNAVSFGAADSADLLKQMLATDQIFTPQAANVLQDLLRSIAGNETTYAAVAPETTCATEMVFAPNASTAFASAPVQVTPSGSPFTVNALPVYGTLSIDGGTITGITMQRGAWSRTLATSTALIPISPGDTVIITYSSAPTIYLIPRV